MTAHEPRSTGDVDPLLLLHGVSNNHEVWRHVRTELSDRFDVRVPIALGHSGGQEVGRDARPATIRMLVDHLERQMDEMQLSTAHVAGNSMGGWMALELARRGRARTVCALSPAGTWGPDGRPETNKRLRRSLRIARLTRPIAPIALRSPLIRRRAMHLTAEHGDRLTRQDMLAVIDASLDCAVVEDLFDTEESLAPLDPLPCPITIAWSRGDRVLPLESNGRRAMVLVPGATFVVLDNVGHVPMLDDASLVAATITRAATQNASA